MQIVYERIRIVIVSFEVANMQLLTRCWSRASCPRRLHWSVGRCQGTAPAALHISNVLSVSPSLTPTPLLVPGCHLYSINTHHGSELRIVAAIRYKLLLITRKRFEGFSAVATGADSPVEEFQYIRVQRALHEWMNSKTSLTTDAFWFKEDVRSGAETSCQ